jgi:hypothetical protein
MEIAFKTNALRTICLSATAMDERYGVEQGALLRRCLADMRAAECFRDVPLLDLSPVSGRLYAEGVVRVAPDLKIVLKANHRKLPQLECGEVDWCSVDRVVIQKIEQIHG